MSGLNIMKRTTSRPEIGIAFCREALLLITVATTTDSTIAARAIAIPAEPKVLDLFMAI